VEPITDLFQSLQIVSVVYARLEATAPWGLKPEADTEEKNRKHSAARSTFQFAPFGMLTRGNCWLSVRGMPETLPLAGGDCFLLAPGISYALRDNPRRRTQSFCDVAPRDGSQIIQYGGGGAPTTIILGWFRFGATSLKPLTRLPPPLILVKADQPQTLALRTTVNMLASEMAEPTPGSDLVVNRLADVLFIQCLRAHIASRSQGGNNGLLRAIFDPQIGVALKSMHEKVDALWTVETLAVACGMSRSAFALRFKELVGETPLEYLTSWRMQKAAALLQKGDRKLIDVARSVGYDSDAAFSKAFKRVVSVTPRDFRRRSQRCIGKGAAPGEPPGVS
jgi:AraC-like DNA-binding protein